MYENLILYFFAGKGILGQECVRQHGAVQQRGCPDTEHVRVCCLYGHNNSIDGDDEEDGYDGAYFPNRDEDGDLIGVRSRSAGRGDSSPPENDDVINSEKDLDNNRSSERNHVNRHDTSGASIRIAVELSLSSVPLLLGARECILNGVFSSLHPQNIRCSRAVGNVEFGQDYVSYPLLYDPQVREGSPDTPTPLG
jgi:hypothetical protein